MNGIRAIGDLGDYREVRLPQGTIRYRERGSGAPLVFVHGALTNGALWRNVVPPLAGEFRCIVPDWPLGGHRPPMPPDADLTLAGLARLIAGFLAALDLREVTLIGNGTGGALCQRAVADHPERIGRLVLTNCDTADNFPPALLRPVVWAARLPGFVPALAATLRLPALHRPLFKLVAKRPPEPAVMAAQLAPFLTDAGVRRDVRKLLLGMSPAELRAAEARLRAFAGPVLLVWGQDDGLAFPMKHARRLQRQFADARLREVADSSTFISEDQPLRLAEELAAFLHETTPAAREFARTA